MTDESISQVMQNANTLQRPIYRIRGSQDGERVVQTRTEKRKVDAMNRRKDLD